MRLLRLELERYGHFTDRMLEFRPDARLHVVYGANEAGKSSSLHAIADLLFGFPHITSYDFLHEKTKLCIGATLESRDATRLICKRRKGIKNTLLDEAGKPLTEEALQSMLGPVSRPVFEHAFGLSKETLRTGAEEMLRSGGEAGSSLIAAAAGIKGLSELRKRLEVEAAAIFAPTRSQHRTFYQARDRQEEAARSMRQLELRDRDLKDRRLRITTFVNELTAARQQRGEAIQRREFLARQREIGPLLLAIGTQEELLKAYAHLPAVESVRILELRAACDLWEKHAAELQRLKNERRGAIAAAEGFIVDHPLIARGPAINALLSESGSYAAEKTQLPRVEGEAEQFRRKLSEFRLRLGLAPDADVILLLPSDLVIAAVREQINAGKRIEADAAALTQRLAREKAAHKDLLKRRTAYPAAGDPAPLRERLARIMPVLSRLGEAERLQRVTLREGLQLRERAAQLSPPIADLDALAGTSLPAAETVAVFAARGEQLAWDLATRQAARTEIENALPTFQAAVEAQELQPLEATPEHIAEVRTARAGRWAPLRSILLRESEPLPAGETAGRIVQFEKTIDTADRLSDDAVRNADRLASRAGARKRLEEELERLRQAVASLSEQEGEIARYDEEWARLWAPLGLTPGPARKMEGWLAQVRDLFQRRAAVLAQQSEFEEIAAALRGIDPAFRELGRLVDIPETDTLPPALLRQGIEEEIERRAEAWRQSHETATLVQAAEERLVMLESEQHELREHAGAWSQAWAEVMSSVNLPASTAVEQAEAALEVWQQVPSVVAQLQDRTRRVAGMERDMQSFEARCAALLAELGEADLSLGADEAAKSLAGRLTEALQVQSMARQAEKRVAELGEQIVTTEAHVGSAREALDGLCKGLPPAEQASLQIAELEARESILASLRQQRRTLLALSRGRSEAELRAAMDGFDDAAAAAEIEELQTRQMQLGEEENEIFARLREAEKQLEELENGAGAEIALQLKRNAESQLLHCARVWAVKRVAQMLLSDAIEHYRSQQEAPLLKRAGELFSGMTAESFSGIEQAYDESDAVRLVGRRAGAGAVGIEAMSEGTRDQLYLALRLAYLEDYATRAEPLPFIGDDLLTNFDDGRTRRALGALGAVGGRMQPILFTHHQRVVELAESELGTAVDVIRLD